MSGEYHSVSIKCPSSTVLILGAFDQTQETGRNQALNRNESLQFLLLFL